MKERISMNITRKNNCRLTQRIKISPNMIRIIGIDQNMSFLEDISLISHFNFSHFQKIITAFQQFLLIINQMENKLKEICFWISNIAQLQATINQNRLSSNQVKALLQMVDLKGKGFLNLNDIYELAGKITENELFSIFKYLDTERTGEIKLEQLEHSLGNPSLSSRNTSKEHIFPKFYTIIDTVKDKPKLIAETKKKHALTPTQLKATYEHICNLVQTKYITSAELVTVIKTQSMKHGLKWGQENEKVIGDLLPGQSVSLAKFIECFSGEGYKCKEEGDEENLLSDIDDNGYYRKEEKGPKVSPITLGKSACDNESNPSIIYKKANNFFQNSTINTPSFRTAVDIKVSSNQTSKINTNQSPKMTTTQSPKITSSQSPKFSSLQNSSSYKRQFDQIEGNINEVLGAIQQRRDKLRQDSQERKKLIEEVLNRKRQLCDYSYSKGPSSPKESSWRQEETSYNSNFNHLKSSYKGYLSATPSSYSKQTTYPQQSPLQKDPYINNSYHYSSEFATENIPETFTYLNSRKPNIQARLGGQTFATPQFKYRSRPSSALNQSYTEANQILKKYNRNDEVKNREEDDMNTLKQLCKSKSGLIYSQSFGNSPLSGKYPIQGPQSIQQKYLLRQQMHSSMNTRAASKENVMKRAEEEAAKKIEYIQRKARMKVLEKKNTIGRAEKDSGEWKKLVKKGMYY